jgi:hypothetical protein
MISNERHFRNFQGAAQKKSVTSVVGGWSETKKGPGSDLFPRYLFDGVFELPSPRNAQKRDKQKSRKKRFWIFGRFFCKV